MRAGERERESQIFYNHHTGTVHHTVHTMKKLMLTTVTMWRVRTETHITSQHQIREQSSQFLHSLNSRSVISVSPRASLILKEKALYQDLYKCHKILTVQQKSLSLRTFAILAGTPKISTHFKPFSTSGRSIPSSLLIPYLQSMTCNTGLFK